MSYQMNDRGTRVIGPNGIRYGPWDKIGDVPASRVLFRLLRERLGVSQERLGALLGMSASAVARKEQGRMPVNARDLICLRCFNGLCEPKIDSVK